VMLPLLNHWVPPEMVIVPLKPDWPTVHAVFDSALSVGGGLMVIEAVPVATAPVASWTLILMLLNVPTAVGVPPNPMRLPAMCCRPRWCQRSISRAS
jgi:hypothetical protein